MTTAARPDPAAPDRALAQRQRILDAARQCFVEHGFHGASMAQIAQAAGISAGLAYCYFDSKHAIMLAIIDGQLQLARECLPAICHGHDVLEAVLADFSLWQRGSSPQVNPALFLETSAEGTRSPEIAQALQRSDAWVRREFQRQLGGRDDEQAEDRALLLQCLIEGLLVRAAREPDLDPGRLRRAMQPIRDWLAAAPGTPPTAAPQAGSDTAP